MAQTEWLLWCSFLRQLLSELLLHDRMLLLLLLQQRRSKVSRCALRHGFNFNGSLVSSRIRVLC